MGFLDTVLYYGLIFAVVFYIITQIYKYFMKKDLKNEIVKVLFII